MQIKHKLNLPACTAPPLAHVRVGAWPSSIGKCQCKDDHPHEGAFQCIFLDTDLVYKVPSKVSFTMQIKVVPHEMGACYLTAIRHRYILDIMEEVHCSVMPCSC